MTRKENLIRAIRRNDPAWVPYRYDGSLTMLDPAVIARAMDGGLDDWGVNWVPSGTDEGSYPEEKAVLRLADVETFEAPQTDWQHVTADLERQIAEQRQVDTLIIIRNEMVLFEQIKQLLGTNECLMGLISNPNQTHVLLDKIGAYQKQLTRCLMESGAAGVRFTDDWGIQDSLFIDPAQWREFVKPRMKELYRVVKAYDGIVFQHTCGHVEEVVPDLIEIGVDVLDPCQPQSNDIFGWKEQYGDRLSFMGGLDTQTYLSFGTPQEVREAVKRVVSVMSTGGGYIAAPSHTITIPAANRQAMEDAIQEVNCATPGAQRAVSGKRGTPPHAGSGSAFSSVG